MHFVSYCILHPTVRDHLCHLVFLFFNVQSIIQNVRGIFIHCIVSYMLDTIAELKASGCSNSFCSETKQKIFATFAAVFLLFLL